VAALPGWKPPYEIDACRKFAARAPLSSLTFRLRGLLGKKQNQSDRH
jgi:hypothetical protein